jgi:hypothetical protein
MYSSIPVFEGSRALRVPSIPFPAYRYVPGVNPHPIKHVDGHSYNLDQSYEWSEGLTWQDDIAWLRGLDFFDHRFYWEAHEVWEGRWKQVDGLYKSLLQGMILSSACLLQRHMGRHAIAMKSWERAKELLARPLENGITNGIKLDLFVAEMNRELPLGGWPVIENSD